jgi:glycerate kinase
MRVLVAPDKFKDSLSARCVAEQIALGIRDVLPTAVIDIALVADGGEGTVEVISDAHGGEWIGCAAHDALGRPIDAQYLWLNDTATAVIEMSEAAGLSRIAPPEREPLRANTFGVGEMLLDAHRHGAREIVVALGGSATTDGGFGLARAIGYRFIGTSEHELTDGPGQLVNLKRIVADHTSVPPIVAAADVRNPLLGARGTARVFAQQKGATVEQIEILERALTRLADVAARDLGRDLRDQAGAGAAGGLGFGLMTFCAASLRAGFDLVAEMIDLRTKVAAADVIVTGEGRLDAQSYEGKAPAGVARLAREAGKPVFGIVGSANDEDGPMFDGVFVLARPPLTVNQAIASASELLRARARELAARF